MKQSIRKILVPLDHSEAAFGAAEIAYAIACSMRASLTLLHIHIREKAVRESVEIPSEELMTLSDDQYQSLLRKVASDPSRKLLQETVRESEIEIEESSHSHSTEICEYAKKHDMDLIVIGFPAHSMFHDMLFGNITAQVLRKAHCRVTVVTAGRSSPAV